MTLRDRLASITDEEAVSILADGMLWVEIGPKLTCTEAETFLGVLLNAGAEPDLCVELLRWHAASDDEPTDAHHHWYIDPQDPREDA